MDVIRASSIGIKNTVALMGTALTNEQIQLIKRLSKNIVLCLDGDNAGVKATLSIGEVLLDEGIEVKVVYIPNNDDPDSFILKHGEDRFKSLIDTALNFNDFKLNRLKDNVNFQSDLEKANYINTVLKETSKIQDDIRVEIVLKRLAKEFDIGYNTLEKRFSEFKALRPVKEVAKIVEKPKSVKKTKYDKAVEQVLYFMINNDWVISQVEKERVVFPSEESRVLSSEITYYYKKYGSINVADFYTYVQDKEDILILLNSILANGYSDKATKDELFEYFRVIKDYRCKKEIERLTNLLKSETDPLEQSIIAEKIRKLRMGE